MTLLLYFILALLPVILYIAAIYFTVPWKSIDIRASGFYFMIGLVSIGILLTIHQLFPGISSPVLNFPFTFIGQPYDTFFFLSFVQVAILEESSKYLSFLIADKIRKNDIDFTVDSPIGTMFYCGITALGFSFIENVDYAIRYGGNVLLIRSVVSMLLHFLSGLLMGYWVAAGRISPKIENRSFFEVILHKRKKLRKTVYTIIGISVAVLLHGLFDFNAFTEASVVSEFLILFGGAVSAYLAARNLMEKMKR